MNSKFAKMALPGLVFGLALGLTAPAVSFAQDHHDDGGKGGSHSGGGGGGHGSGDHNGGGNRGGGGERGGGDRGGGGGDRGGGQFVGARTQTGAAVHPEGAAAAAPQTRDWHGRGGDDRGNGGDMNRGGGDPRGGARGDYHGDPRGGGRGDARGDFHGAGGMRGGGGGHFDWHGDSRFHGYNGLRSGFYFAPGRGYYHVPSQYYGHRWGRGEYLPRFFFDYRIYDPDYHDLPYPPYGCAYFFVGEDAVLVDLDTGEIVDVIYGVY